MAGLDLSRLAPADAVVALRSLPRRYRAALASPLVDDRPASDDDLVHRVGPDGCSAVDHVEHVVRTLALLDRAVEQTQVADEPVLHPAVLDDRARQVDPDTRTGPPAELGDVLDDLAAVCERLADRVGRVPASGWARTARIAGGGPTTAHDLLKEAVGAGVEHLWAAEATLAGLRGQP